MRHLAAFVHGGVVHVHDILSLLPIALVNELLHLLDGHFVGDDVRYLEEGRLHNRVGTVAKTEFRGYLRRIDDVEIDMVLGQVRLHVVGQRLLYRINVL